ncbi:MAG: dTMP kinase [Bacillota bacterium]|nr:dTMP kinase [Candidatus Fermentithermobacillaceae bacterium]
MPRSIERALPGVFISLEGCDGSGKSTQLSRLSRKLGTAGLNPLVTREPGGTPFGERIRQLLLDPDSPDRSILSETLLYAAARCEFVSKIVRPALVQGRVVITERYADSTWVYQGYAGGVPLSTIETLNAIATGGLEPDLTLVLDIGRQEVVDERLASKRKDKIESRSDEYHQKVREGYRELAKRFPHRVVCIDGGLDVCVVEAMIWKEVVNILSKKGYDFTDEKRGRESL